VMRRFWAILSPLLLVLTALVSVSAPATAGSKATTIEFGNVGTVVRAANGDTVELFGAGTFTLQPKSVSGDAPAVTAAFGAIPRTFTHRDAGGNLLATGTWEPTAVLSYRSFGPATPEQIAFFGGLPEGSEGGKLAIKVALFVGGAHVHDGIITFVCELGVPPKNSVETALLLVQGTDLNFNQPVDEGDGNIFIRH
jgi:hypothetical protein